MKMNKFKKPKKNSIYNPVDWFNEFGTFQQIFEGDKKCISFSDTEATYPVSDATDLSKSPNFILNKNFLVNSGFNEIFLSLRGMLNGEYYTLTQFFSEELLSSLLIAEDKWDFMLHSNNQILHDYIFEIESGCDFSEKFIFQKKYNSLISTFSIMDINSL